MEQEIKYTDFTDDFEKMADFKRISKEEFLRSYSYLTEEEYDLTFEKVYNTSSKVKILETPRKTFEEVQVEAQLEINGKTITVRSYHKESDYGDYDTDCGIAEEDLNKLTEEEQDEINEYLDTFDWGY